MNKVKVVKNSDHVLFSTTNGEYHMTLQEFTERGESNAKEYALAEIEKKNKAGQYSDSTINFTQARELGFCEYGIEDFCNRLGLNKDNTYKIADLNKALTLEVLKEYPNECIKLFGKDTLKYLGGVKGVLNKDTVDLVLRPEFIEEKKLHELSVKFAYDCLDNFEKDYPNDDRPRRAIEAKQKWIEGKITDEELKLARSKALSAAGSVRSTANVAAYSATWSAADAARSAAKSVRSVAYSAVMSAIRSAAYLAIFSTARSAARERQVKMILEVL